MKSTLRTFILSLLLLVICTTCFISTTFAYFSVDKSTGNNRIVSGTLEVDLLMDMGTGYKSIARNPDDLGTIFNEIDDGLWDAGSVKVAYMRILNKGNLALKYDLMTFFSTSDLNQYLDFAIVKNVSRSSNLHTKTYNQIADLAFVKGNVQTLINAQGNAIPSVLQGIIVPENNYLDFALVMHLHDNIPNSGEYVSMFDIRLNAIQAPFEADSFGTAYDQNLLNTHINPSNGMSFINPNRPIVVEYDQSTSSYINTTTFIVDGIPITPVIENNSLDFNGNPAIIFRKVENEVDCDFIIDKPDGSKLYLSIDLQDFKKTGFFIQRLGNVYFSLDEGCKITGGVNCKYEWTNLNNTNFIILRKLK